MQYVNLRQTSQREALCDSDAWKTLKSVWGALNTPSDLLSGYQLGRGTNSPFSTLIDTFGFASHLARIT